jgi:glucose-6-phosphate 1-dehydrogenase
MKQPAASPLMSGLLVIFGITGDLSRRYLLPSLYALTDRNLLPEHFEIIGATRRGVEVSELLAAVEARLKQTGQKANPDTLRRLGQMMRIVKMDPTSAPDYAALKTALDRIEDERGVCLNRLFYLSIPPHTYGPVVDLLGHSGLAQGCQHGTADSRIMVEKPFGYDLESARELIHRLKANFHESQIFRIVHYLAKETAQNILTFRFANPIFRPIWDHRHISGITITAAETIGIEGRAGFYETTGALRDFVQNHLLQLLAITAMDEPTDLNSAHIHAKKLELLRAITPIKPNQVGQVATRGQYQGYTDEVGNPDSFTETFARLKLEIANDRWLGVPIVLQTGKMLDRRFTEIDVTFDGSRLTNTLCFRIQPDEGIAITLKAKKPGLGNDTGEVEMEFNYDEAFGAGTQPGAYERVLMDGIRGDQTLFTSSDEVLTSWKIVEAVVSEWSKSGAGLIVYKAGTAADAVT